MPTLLIRSYNFSEKSLSDPFDNYSVMTIVALIALNEEYNSKTTLAHALATMLPISFEKMFHFTKNFIWKFLIKFIIIFTRSKSKEHPHLSRIIQCTHERL